MHDAWRNEQQAQQQLQQDEEEEECNRSYEEREIIQRQLRLEEVTNDVSRQDLVDYEASISNQNPQELSNVNQPPAQPPFQPDVKRHASLQPPPPARGRQRNQTTRGRTTYQEPATQHSLGPMNISCPNCHALHLLQKNYQHLHEMCQSCLTGQIILPPFPPLPQELLHLFDGTSPHSLEFKTNIHQYNATFAFTSLGANFDHSVFTGTGPYSFWISGQLYHWISALLPIPNQAPSFAQLYIHDPNQQLDYREGNNDHSLSWLVMTIIQGVLHLSHPYVELYKQAYQILREKPAEEQDTVAI